MKLREMVRRLEWLLNANSTADQAFKGPSNYANEHKHMALTDAYRDEWVRACSGATDDWKIDYQDITWPSGQQIFSLPEALSDGRAIYRFDDVTDDSLGVPLWVYSAESGGTIQHLGRDKFIWGTSGPDSDVTIRVTYEAVPAALTEDDQEPYLIPSQFHHLLVWSAAIELRDIADEEAPKRWLRRQEALQMQLEKHMSRPRIKDTSSTHGRDYGLSSLSEGGY